MSPEERIAELEGQLEVDPNRRGEILTRIGEIHLANGRLEVGLEIWNDAASAWSQPLTDERAAAGYINRHARTFEDRGHLDRVLDPWLEALRSDLEPDHRQAWLAVIFCAGLFPRFWIPEDQLDRKLTEADRKRAASPEVAVWHALAGHCHALSGDLGAAVAAFGESEEVADGLRAWELRTGAILEIAARAAGVASGGEWARPDFARIRGLRPESPLDGLARIGVPPDQIREWSGRGFDGRSALAWWKAGVEPQVAKEWRSIAAPPLVQLYLAAGVRPSASLRIRSLEDWEAWRRAGFDLKSASSWAAKVRRLQDAVAWREAGVDLRRVAAWIEAGVTAATAATWKALDFSPRDSGLWSREAFTPAEADQWRRAGFGPDAAAAWRTTGRPEALRWRRVSADFEERRRWLDAGVDLHEATAWRRIGVDPEAARAWIEAGFARDSATDWIRAAFSPEDARREQARGSNAFSAREQRRQDGLEPYSPVGHRALLFWGVAFEAQDRVPWRPDDPGAAPEHWVRCYADATGRSPDEHRCVVGVSGEPASFWHPWLAIEESVQVATDGRTLRLSTPAAQPSWKVRIQAVLDGLSITDHPAPGWFLAAAIVA